MTNNDNKDAAATTNKGNGQPQQSNSPRRNRNNQEEAVTLPIPRGSTLETCESPSVFGPTRPTGTEVGASATAVTPTGGSTPPTPVRIGWSGAGVDSSVAAAAAGASGEANRKRSGKAAEEGSSPVPRRGKREMDINPDTEPTCSECGRTFASWKAVFGHMRAHPDRGWRGAIPPPEWSPENPDDQQGDRSERIAKPISVNAAKYGAGNSRKDEAGSM
jgi:hypothetical protein